MESIDPVIRWGWLKFMYIYTVIGAGLLGLVVIVAPELAMSILGLPFQDPVIFGVFGSVYAAFGILSILGLRFPLKFVPILLFQLSYKVIWLLGVALPLMVEGQLPAYGYIFSAIFLSYVIGDLIAIPFGYIFGKDTLRRDMAGRSTEHN